MGIRSELHQRFIAWAQRVPFPEAAPVILTQRRIYILPTGIGIGYGAALFIMLLGALNYNLSLGYVLTFLLVGQGIVAILHTFRNLVRLTISPIQVKPVFAGETAVFRLQLSADTQRFQVRLSSAAGASDLVDIAHSNTGEATLLIPAQQRGWLALPRITLETRFPLGLFRAWAYCCPDFQCIVYPQPAAKAPPPPSTTDNIGNQSSPTAGDEDFSELRDHRPADSLHRVAWKTAARLGPEAPLKTKQFADGAGTQIWFDWNQLAAEPDIEIRLSILTRWIIDAHNAKLIWGLRIPGKILPPNSGTEHLQAALTALALYGADR